jgi:hypothetical protein
MSAKRAKPVATPRRSETLVTPALATEEAEGEQPRWPIWLAVTWLVGFCLFFYSFALPNNREEWTRLGIWAQLPELLSASALFSARWGNLWQRADIFGIAAFILAGAWGLGNLALRLLAPAIERRTAEWTFFAMGLGLTATSLLTLLLGLAGILSRPVFVGVFLAAIAGEIVLRARRVGLPESGDKEIAPRLTPGTRQGYSFRALRDMPAFWIVLATVVPFLFVMWLGSMSPETDFDVREYHFEGPKEYFQNGRITFLPHNIYTSFPFLNEMFVLLGMVLRNDWYWGALAGKCVLFAYAPLTALGLFAAGRRWFGPMAGLLAALVYLTTPWIDRITTIAYVEGGLSFFLYAALFAVMLSIERMRHGALSARLVLLAGLLAGSGMACKYTGVLQVVLPMGIALVAAPWFGSADARGRLRPTLLTAAAFSAGVAITIGPWLLKNVAETGNPVYPLAYSIFGGGDLSPELDAKFRVGHTAHTPRTLVQGFVDVIADNDWSSPLWYGLAPLAFLVGMRRSLVTGLWLFVGYLFVTWWAFTHQIDRFWVPMIPVVSLLAGIGGAWSEDPFWRWGRNLVLGLAILFNFAFEAGTETDYLCGANAFLSDLRQARERAENPYIAFLNQTLPKSAKVLCVGEAEVFEARFPVVYNTVFDRSIFQEWFAVDSPGTPARELRLKPIAQIRAKLHDEGITHINVNWREIERYQSPGSYGYSEFVTPQRFDQLVADGVLLLPQTLGRMSVKGMSDAAITAAQASLGRPRQTADGRVVIVTGLIPQISDDVRAAVKKLGPSLVTQADGHDVLIDAQIFRVR